ncbi:MAG: DUF5060 domain-containing protein [Puniceicoccaceae bacterium]
MQKTYSRMLALILSLNPVFLQAIAVTGVPETLIFEEQDGLLAVEAEHFFKQTDTDVRAWYPMFTVNSTGPEPDGDPSHVVGASKDLYLEILPDTRRSHGDKLIRGENFSNFPTPMATLHYKVKINTPGRYYVWARLYSTNTEDNGLHVGLNGEWPASGSRMQWTAKNQWFWDSKQRTEEVHTGVPGLIYLDIEEPGEHVIMFSMREDGTEFDKWLMTLDPEFERPEDAGPVSRVRDTRDGDGTVTVGGDLQTWHKVTLDLAGPWASETNGFFNPFTACRMTVIFRHESGDYVYHVPGYFAADGNARETSATEGNIWRAHLSPDVPGEWTYTIRFASGPMAAVDPAAGSARGPFDGTSGSFIVTDSDKTGVDFRARGRLTYTGDSHLRFAGDKSYFLKAGPDAPETLLAYTDFDNTETRKPDKGPLKTWEPHLQDWKVGDPTWQDGKGKSLIGALNYLAGKGMNTVSFLTYNAGGDGDNVWPFVEREDKFRYDVSKLDQWATVLEHAQSKGIHLHFKLQENELDDHREGNKRKPKVIPEAMDAGLLGPERKLYFREIIARFGHNLALNWNLGEENTQTYEEQRDMAAYLAAVDPYGHNLVIHTFPEQQDSVYPALLGSQSALTGASLQNSWDTVHQRTLQWVKAAQLAGRTWVVANDEQGPHHGGVPPDPEYQGFSGSHEWKGKNYDLHDIRKYTLWGNLMAGGAGVEYYFGYKLPETDLLCEDFRSRDRSWDYCRVALEFFTGNAIPFWRMSNHNHLVGNISDDNSRYCFAESGTLYLVYLPEGGSSSLDLTGQSGTFSVNWFNPRKGGDLMDGQVPSVSGGGVVDLGMPPDNLHEDWLIVVRK